MAVTGAMLAVGAPGAHDNGGRVDFFALSDLSTAGAIEPGDEHENARLGTNLLAAGDHLLLANPRAVEARDLMDTQPALRDWQQRVNALTTPEDGDKAMV